MVARTALPTAPQEVPCQKCRENLATGCFVRRHGGSGHIAPPWRGLQAASADRVGHSLGQGDAPARAEAIELRASLAQNYLRHSDAARRPRHRGRARPAAGRNSPGLCATGLTYHDHVTGEALDAHADSTGCATGATCEDAVRAALLECLERDPMGFWRHGGLPAAPLALDLIDRLQPRLWWLQERRRRAQPLDLPTDTGATVVAAIAADPVGYDVATGTAARLTTADAALSAVTKMVQIKAAMAQAEAVQDPEYLGWRDHACTGA